MDKPNNHVVYIDPKEHVKVTKMNHIIEVQHMAKMNRTNHIKKLDKDSYVDLSTGEIKQFEHSANRHENYNSLRQTFKRLRYLINNNYTGGANELHVILTYKKNMTDPQQLYDDFRKFMQRLKYKYRKKSTIDYLSVVEPQGRGAWHMHVLIRFNDLSTIYIKNSDLRELWVHGFVTIKRLEQVDNIGAYLSAYLADIELNEETVMQAITEGREIVEKEVEGKTKRYIKGGRLHMYPVGMNLYRKSKGIIKPDREEIRYENIKKIVGSATPHYSKTYEIQSEDFENTITFIQYNLKRE